MVTASRSPICAVNNSETKSSGLITKRISSWMHPYQSTCECVISHRVKRLHAVGRAKSVPDRVRHRQSSCSQSRLPRASAVLFTFFLFRSFDRNVLWSALASSSMRPAECTVMGDSGVLLLAHSGPPFSCSRRKLTFPVGATNAVQRSRNDSNNKNNNSRQV